MIQLFSLPILCTKKRYQQEQAYLISRAPFLNLWSTCSHNKKSTRQEPQFSLELPELPRKSNIQFIWKCWRFTYCFNNKEKDTKCLAYCNILLHILQDRNCFKLNHPAFLHSFITFLLLKWNIVWVTYSIIWNIVQKISFCSWFVLLKVL